MDTAPRQAHPGDSVIQYWTLLLSVEQSRNEKATLTLHNCLINIVQMSQVWWRSRRLLPLSCCCHRAAQVGSLWLHLHFYVLALNTSTLLRTCLVSTLFQTSFRREKIGSAAGPVNWPLFYFGCTVMEMLGNDDIDTHNRLLIESYQSQSSHSWFVMFLSHEALLETKQPASALAVIVQLNMDKQQLLCS